jgi:hypothetical protein
MMKLQNFILMKSGRRICFLLTVMLTLAMTLLSQPAWAYSYELELKGCGAGPNNVDPYIWGYVNGGETQVNWSSSRGDITSYENGLGITLSSSKSMTVRSQQTFTGVLSKVALRMKRSSDAKHMSITTKAIDEQGVSTQLSNAYGQTAEGDFVVTLNPTVMLNNQYIELTISSNESSEWNILEWTLIGVDIEEFVYYDLYVGGVQVTSANKNNITDDYTLSGSFRFDATSNTLYIDGTGVQGGASITTTDKHAIENVGLEGLTIKIKGKCSINAESNSYQQLYNCIYSYNEVPLAIVKDPTGEGSSTLSLFTFAQTNSSPVIAGFSGVSYSRFATYNNYDVATDYTYDRQERRLMEEGTTGSFIATYVKFVSMEYYDVYVGDTQITSQNKDDITGDGTLSYNPDGSILTVNGCETSLPIISQIDALTIKVKATSSVGPITWEGKTGNPTLTFVRDGEDGDVELTIESASGGPAISGFSEVLYTNLEPARPYGVGIQSAPKVIMTPLAYPLWIGDYLPPTRLTADRWITELNENQEEVVTASFDTRTFSLTLNNFNHEFSTCGMIAQIRDFTVNLRGNNSIFVVEGEQPAMMVGSAETNILTFKTEEDEPGSLALSSRVVPINGSGLTVNCQNGLVRIDRFYEVNNSYYTTIETLMAPQMYLITSTGTPLLAFEGVDEGIELHYSIDYVSDELDDVTDALFDPNDVTGEGFPEILGPCTVTAYTQYGDTKSATVKGKYFALSDSYPSVVYGKVESMAAPTLLPAIEDGDGITVSYSAEKAPAEAGFDNIATINPETGEIAIVGPGTVPFIVELDIEDGYKCKVLNRSVDQSELTFYLTVSAGYNLYVNGEQVTEANRKHILGVGNESVVFDGGHTLILDNATLNSVETAQRGDEQLTIFLKGDNAIGNESVAVAIRDRNQGIGSLVFETASNNPGRLTLKATSAVVSNYRSVDLKQPLTIVSSTPEGATSLIGTTAAITEAYIAPPMELIIDDVASTSQGTSTDIDYGNLTGPNVGVATHALNNKVINNLLYTLNDTQTGSVNDDGYDDTRGLVVINSTMTDDQVREIHDLVQWGKLTPGSTEYAEYYKGLTFRVPGGTGRIMLDVQVESGFEFHVKIGSQEPVSVKSSGIVNLNYTACEATYVYVYLVNPNGHNDAPALANDSRRIGPKTTVSGRLGGLSVSSNNITSAPAVSSDYMMLSAGSMAPIFGSASRGSHITLGKDEFGDVTDLEPGLFSPKAQVSSAPMHEMEADDVLRAPATNIRMPEGITYIDLRETSIVGMEVSRTAGAFKDVPENTFIYMPAGNSVAAGTKNVVIAGICDDVLLDASADAPFELAGDVAAAKATLSVSMADGTNSAAICLPYELKNPEDYGRFYKLNKLYANNTALNMAVEKGTIKANTPYIFDAKAGAKVAGKVLLSQPNITLSKAAQLGEDLVGVYDTQVGYGYLPGAKRSDGKFVSTTVLPFGAYVPAGSGDKLTITWGGDVNKSGDISITDAEGVVNKILGTPAPNFDLDAGDVNGDDDITITDAVDIVNIILGTR